MLNISDFTNVYIYVGNYESLKAACQVVVNKSNLDDHNYFRNFESIVNFKSLYLLVSDTCRMTLKVTYEIIDQNYKILSFWTGLLFNSWNF